ncbi:MAG: hypothetical protein WCC87_23345 [Candidatus Korobacteraceae bacterium]
MKRQLGPILVVLAVVLYGSAAWSQSGSMDPSQNGVQQPGSMDPSQNGSQPSMDPSQNVAQPSSTDSSQNGSSDSSQSSSTQNNSGQNGSNDSSQNGTNNLTPNGFSNPLPGSANDTSQQTPTGPQATFTHPEQLPPLSMLNEVTANTGMQFTLSTGIATDSNATGTDQTDWQGLTSIGGTFGITQIRPNLSWNLNYGGGTNQYLGGPNNYNTVTQSGVAGVLWNLSRRWQLVLQDSYLYSSDPFQPYLTITTLPSFNDPNPTVYIPQATFQTNTATATLTYSMGPHDSFSFSGFENFYRYQGSTLLTLQNSFMWAGSGFYQHVFSAKVSGGGGYEFSALDFGHGESRAGIQTFQGFVSYRINPGMSIAGWVGPELTNTKDIVPYFCIPGYGCLYQAVHSSVFNVAEGANFSWATPHRAFHMKFSHRVTNGGGLLGVVKLYIVTADYRQTLSPRWTLLGGLLYGNNVSITGFAPNEYLNSLTAQIGVARMLNKSWIANAYYAVIDQRQNNVPGYVTPQWLDNRIAINLQYSWGHSLGR